MAAAGSDEDSGAAREERKQQMLSPSKVSVRKEDKEAEEELGRRRTHREGVRRGRGRAREGRRYQRYHPREQEGWYEEYEGVWWFSEPIRGRSNKGTLRHYYWDEENDDWVLWEAPKPARRKRGGGRGAVRSSVGEGRSRAKFADTKPANLDDLTGADEAPPTNSKNGNFGSAQVQSRDPVATDKHDVLGREDTSSKREAHKKKERPVKTGQSSALKNTRLSEDREFADEPTVDSNKEVKTDHSKSPSLQAPKLKEKGSSSTQQSGRNSHRRKGPRERPLVVGHGKRQTKMTVQCDELAQQLMAGSYECMVCCDRVRERDEVWSCLCCYHIFHLRCIGRWARSPAAALSEGQPK